MDENKDKSKIDEPEPTLDDHLDRIAEGLESIEYRLQDMLKIYWSINHGATGLMRQLKLMDATMDSETPGDSDG